MNYPNALSSVTGSVNALPHCFPGRPRIAALYYGTTAKRWESKENTDQ